MTSQNPKKDTWSSLLNDLEVEPTTDSVDTSAGTVQSQPQQPQAASHEKTETTSGKSAKFGSGILPDGSPSSANPKSAISKRTSKMSFFDRLSSINLFGAGSPEKVDRSAAVPTETFVRTTNVSEQVTAESLEPKPLEKTPSQPKTKRPPKTADAPPPPTSDPWSKLASQLDVKAKTQDKQEKAAREPQREKFAEKSFDAPKKAEPTTTSASNEEEIPDIESLVSFRHLPSKKKSAPAPAPKVQEPAPSRSPRTAAEERPRTPSREESPRNDRSRSERGRSERGRSERDRNERPQREKYDREPEFTEESRSPSKRKRGRKYESREELDTAPVYNEPIDLDDFELDDDIPKPSRSEEPSYSFDSVEEEDDFSTSPRKRGRSRRGSRKERDDYPPREEPEVIDDVSDDFDEVYAPVPERQYGPTRDVFADILPEDDGEDDIEEVAPRRPSRSESPRLTRGSRSAASAPERRPARDTFRPAASDTDFDDEPEEQPRERTSRGRERDRGREKPLTRGSRADRGESKRRSFGEIENTFEESSPRPSRQRPQAAREVEEHEETAQDSGERIDLSHLYRDLPSWDDAILPIVRENTARHGNRRSDPGRSRGRR